MKKLSGPMLKAKSGAPKQLVVLLHGYGSDGNDMISLSQFWVDILPDAMFIAPNAPNPCAINPAGFEWFELDTSSAFDKRDNSARLKGSKKAQPVLSKFLNDLWSDTGLSAKDTILGGFSQGAMMALEVGLAQKEALKGIISFSGGLPDPKNMKDKINSKPPICFVHGGNDNMVPVGMSVISNEELKKLGLTTSLHISPAAEHTIAMDGLEFASNFIKGLK